MAAKAILWTAQRFIGVGPLRYEMNREQVQSEIGDHYPVLSAFEEADGSTREFRGLEIPICSYHQEKLTGIDTSYRIKNVVFEKKYLYEMPPLDCLRFLEKTNLGAKIYANLILFDELGISLNGFYSEKENKVYNQVADQKDRRHIGFFKKGLFDRHLHDFREISFSL